MFTAHNLSLIYIPTDDDDHKCSFPPSYGLNCSKKQKKKLIFSYSAVQLKTYLDPWSYLDYVFKRRTMYLNWIHFPLLNTKVSTWSRKRRAFRFNCFICHHLSSCPQKAISAFYHYCFCLLPIFLFNAPLSKRKLKSRWDRRLAYKDYTLQRSFIVVSVVQVIVIPAAAHFPASKALASARQKKKRNEWMKRTTATTGILII